MVKQKRKRAKGVPQCAFGAKIRLLRVQKGLDQAALGRKVGLSRRSIAYYEIESALPPTGDIVVKFAGAFGVTCDFLLDAKPPKDISHLPTDVRQLKRLLQVRTLPRGLQRGILNHIDAALASVGQGKRKK